MKQEPVALFDLGNTLARIKHREYVERVNPDIIPARDQHDPWANQQYEVTLDNGFRDGDIEVEAIEGVREKLEELRTNMHRVAVFSTYLKTSIEAALEKAGLGGLVDGCFSTFVYNSERCDEAMRTAHMKIPEGFAAVERNIQRLGGQTVLYADDNLEEVQRAREGLGERVRLYCVGEKPAGCVDEGIVFIPSIADIVVEQ